MDTNTGSKGRPISDADLDVESSDREDHEDEEMDEEEESSVVSEGVNWSLETPAYKIAVDCPIVAAMQDVQQADDHLPEDLPNMFWNWLWFRRYILGIPQRCIEGMERCHMIELDRGNPAWVKKRELHDELQDLTPADKRRIEFVEHIDWFRQLVFCNDVIAVCRSTSGELGITVRHVAKYSAVREALPGFLSEITSADAARLRSAGYTSLFEDGPRSYVLYGPLALVQHGGGNDVMLGKPLQPFDWVLSSGYKLYLVPTHKELPRAIKLRGEGRGAEGRLRPVRASFRAGEEVRINYHGDTTQLTPEVAPQVAKASTGR